MPRWFHHCGGPGGIFSRARKLRSRRLVAGWLGCEAAFQALCWWRVKDASSTEITDRPLLSSSERRALFNQCVEVLPPPEGRAGLQAFVEGWFKGTPVAQLTSADIKSWLSWGLFSRQEFVLDMQEQQELADYVHKLESLLDVVFPDAKAPTAACMKPDHEPFAFGREVAPLPLLFYLMVLLGEMGSCVWLFLHGFRLHFHPDTLGYWMRDADSYEASKESPVLFFFHGIGIGLLPYCWILVPALLQLQLGAHHSNMDTLV